MSDITASMLADEIESLIRTTPGVTAVYPTAAIPAVVAGEVLANTVVPNAAPQLVGVSVGADGITVIASVGVADDVPAHVTGRAVHARILDYLERSEAAAKDVTVRIGVVGS